jgi:hypothetical protein
LIGFKDLFSAMKTAVNVKKKKKKWRVYTGRKASTNIKTSTVNVKAYI